MSKEKLDESGLSRVWTHMQKHESGTVTAFRSASECNSGDKYSRADNRKRNKSLQSKLQRLGYGITKVKGSYIENYDTPDAIEVGEDVFYVVDLKNTGNLKKDLQKLGEEFEQDSILFIPKGGESSVLIGTNKCPNGYPGYKKTIKFNEKVLGKDGEFFTRVNGRPFVFESVGNFIPEPSGMMGKWACKVISERNWEDIEVDDET